MASASQSGNAGLPSGSNAPRMPPGAESKPLESSTSADGPGQRKKKHRAGRKRKNRRQSFATTSEQSDIPEAGPPRPSLLDVPEGAVTESQFYRIQGRKGSNTSLDSEALLDHREQPQTRPRRQSVLQSMHSNRSNHNHTSQARYSQYGGMSPSTHAARDSRDGYGFSQSHENGQNVSDRTPLISGHTQSSPNHRRGYGYGGVNDSHGAPLRPRSSNRRPSASSSTSRKRRMMPSRQLSSTSMVEEYDINNPPSVPGSPRLGGDDAFDDVLLPEMSDFRQSPQPERRHHHAHSHGRDAIIDVDEAQDSPRGHQNGTTQSPGPDLVNMRRRTVQSPVEDVCMPFDQMTEVGDEDFMQREGSVQGVRRSRRRPWPDLAALEEWSQEEKEERSTEGIRAKKVSEPEMVGGRLRPNKLGWQREDEEAPFRYTYFNEELESSSRSYTLSGLQQLGLTFRELFVPDCPELDDSSSDEEEGSVTPVNGVSRAGTRQSSILDPGNAHKPTSSSDHSGQNTPRKAANGDSKAKRYGPRPVFWLDVLQPTYEEMRVISRAFGIHKLTAEDIMEQEAREKVELFRNYYFVNYRTFEQDQSSEDYLDPVNMYFVVFKGGVISFHFSQMPHPPNVRRRIRQLAEHQYTDSDWISYAIIDNITDAYAPLIEQIEKEVDEIDEDILRQHAHAASESTQQTARYQKYLPKRSDSNKATNGDYEKVPQTDGTAEDRNQAEAGRDMLLRTGECRKKVMSLYRLLGNKADVIKGLAKRCNEQWTVAPRSDVGLYLGDIQDHIVTMTGNLSHYENLLSRSHSNYLAQINIRMTERAEQTNDVLGKLTVLGTIVLPMNIITGMWGMNVLVPGQDVDNLWWFWSITAGLLAFGFTCFFAARKVYGVV
ncbi:MAG: CorA metal ion transporter [Chrysothrix sp. TS-e1954]|nr:MAG: CorA metal ion transporter [Chrysothrix sp. TS-e1954]